MGFSAYKYNPDSYSDIQFLSSDLLNFYKSYEKFLNNKSFENWICLKSDIDYLELTLKQRRLNGVITAMFEEEVNSYIGELIQNA